MRFPFRFFGRKSQRSRRLRRSEYSQAAESLERRTLLTVFTVDTTNDGGTGSLRTTIVDANNNPGFDVILISEELAGQTIQLLSSLPPITDALRINGPVPSKDGITIDGGGVAGIRPFEVDASASLAIFRNMTISGGNTTVGESGGGLLNAGPDTRLINVRVTQNVADQDGGGIQNLGGLTIRDSEISSNRAAIDDGGGIQSLGTLDVRDSEFFNNISNSAGGAIDTRNSGSTATILRTTLGNNRAVFGGGIQLQNDAVLHLDQSLIYGNRATNAGGGIYNFGGGTATITNSTIAFNASNGGDGGGGLSQDTTAGAVTIVNSTIFGNVDDSNNADGGGGIANDGGTAPLNVINTVIAQNFADAGFDEIEVADLDFNANNFIGGNPELGPLQDNGGPTLSMAPQPGSPLIDAGDDSLATIDGQAGSTSLQGDQRTFSRFVDGNANGLVTVDIGAVEFNPGPDIAYVTGAETGQPSRITLYNQDGSLRWSRFAFAPSFTGGVRVAMGDVNGDGIQDVVAGEGPGGQSRFRAFNGVDGTLFFGRAPFGTSYDGGIYVAAADFNNDGRDDIVAGTGGNHIARVRVRNAAMPGQNLWNMRVGTPADMDPVRVAAADVNNDGNTDLITTLGGTVTVFDGASPVFLPPILHQWTPFGPNFSGRLFVAVGRLNNDAFNDIIVSRDTGGPPRIKLYLGNTGPAGGQPNFQQEIMAGDPNSTSGVRVAARDIDGDGLSEIVTTYGPGGRSEVRTYWSGTEYTSFTSFLDEFFADDLDGLFIGIG